MDRFSLTFRWSLLSAALYWGYALAVVPWIEPQIDLDASRAVVPSSVEGSVPRLKKRLRTWFTDEAWEVNEASKILETSQGIIILRNYQNLPDGTVRLWPCSFVLFPNRPDVGEQAMKDQAVVLQASQGAVLRFDSAIDLRTAKLGKLLGGKLVGPVAVRSGGRSPGPEDDLYIAAADVDLSNDLLSSPNEVTFRWGRNQGRGTGLEVKLLVRAGDSGGQTAFEGVRTLQLQERVWMELYLGDKLLRDSAGPTTAAPQAPAPAALPARSGAAIPVSTEQPIHAQSRGMFRFDLVDRQVRFEDDVLLSRPTTAGGAEQLDCEDLLLLFDPAEPAAGVAAKASTDAAAESAPEDAELDSEGRPKPPSGDLKKMTLRDLQAVGRPVKLSSPSRQLEVECELLQWNERTGWLSLGRPQRKEGAAPLSDLPVRAKQGTNEIIAPEMHLQFDRANRQLNRAAASGPGEMWSRASAKPLHVSWTDRLEAVPEGKLQVVHIHGNAAVESEASGKLSADLIRLWLFDGSKPPEAVARLPVPRRSQGSWQPHHLEAGPKVAIQSNLMTGKLNQLELWFEHPAPGAVETVPASPAGRGGASEAVGAPLSSLPRTSGVESTGDGADGEELVPAASADPRGGATAVGPRAVSASHARPGGGTGGPPPKTPARRFTITGDRFWGRVAFIDQKPQLVEGRGDGGIDLLEEAPQSPGAATGLTGDSVQFLQDAQSGEVVSLVGKPARVRSDGMVLEGEAIHFGRTKNEVWVNGPGLLQLKLRAMEEGGRPGAPPANPTLQAVRSPLEVRWRGGMHFDGLAARFEGDVKALWDGKSLRTERLDALLTEKMSFSESPQDAARRRPTLAKLQCPKDFFLESRTFGQGRMISLERMQARDLSVEIEAGFVVAQGPGWVMQVRSGGFSLDGKEAGAKPTAPGRGGLQYLQSTFQEELSGNFKQRHLRFHGQVETVYGPVDDWDEGIDPDRLGPEAFWMRCDLLGVRQTPEVDGGKATYELDALDDVQLEGREFSGAAARLSYNQAKDLLVLEGDGRADARLVRQPQPGGNASRYAARKILYWRTFDRVKIEDGRQAEVDGGPPVRGR